MMREDERENCARRAVAVRVHTRHAYALETHWRTHTAHATRQKFELEIL